MTTVYEMAVRSNVQLPRKQDEQLRRRDRTKILTATYLAFITLAKPGETIVVDMRK